jgi:hypothetical protein
MLDQHDDNDTADNASHPDHSAAACALDDEEDDDEAPFDIVDDPNPIALFFVQDNSFERTRRRCDG